MVTRFPKVSPGVLLSLTKHATHSKPIMQRDSSSLLRLSRLYRTRRLRGFWADKQTDNTRFVLIVVELSTMLIFGNCVVSIWSVFGQAAPGGFIWLSRNDCAYYRLTSPLWWLSSARPGGHLGGHWAGLVVMMIRGKRYFRPRCYNVRLYWVGDNLGNRDEFGMNHAPGAGPINDA